MSCYFPNKKSSSSEPWQYQGCINQTNCPCERRAALELKKPFASQGSSALDGMPRPDHAPRGRFLHGRRGAGRSVRTSAPQLLGGRVLSNWHEFPSADRLGLVPIWYWYRRNARPILAHVRTSAGDPAQESMHFEWVARRVLGNVPNSSSGTSHG